MNKKDVILAVVMTIIFLILVISLMFYGSYRSHQIENGQLEIVYQYGGDL